MVINWGKITVHDVPRDCESRGRYSYKTECDQCDFEDYSVFFEVLKGGVPMGYTNFRALCWRCIRTKHKYDGVVHALNDRK